MKLRLVCNKRLHPSPGCSACTLLHIFRRRITISLPVAGGQNVRRGGDNFPDLLAALSLVFRLRVPQQKHSDQSVRSRPLLEFLLVGYVQFNGQSHNILLDESKVSLVHSALSKLNLQWQLTSGAATFERNLTPLSIFKMFCSCFYKLCKWRKKMILYKIMIHFQMKSQSENNFITPSVVDH